MSILLPKLLIIEADVALCDQYRWAFPSCEVVFAHNRTQALALARKERPAVAIMELGLPPDRHGVSEGFATLAGLARQTPNTKVIVATNLGDRRHALRAMAGGAYDTCEKPIEFGLLNTIVARGVALQTVEDENRHLPRIRSLSPIKSIVTADPGMLKVCRDIERLAAPNVPVLLLGESGTGKEALARALHDLGPRANQPFVAINCGAIPDALLESELFGYERGAFTGAMKQTLGKIELAHKGTLFLDEVGDLPHSLQAKLLRFLQDQQVERVGGRQLIQVDVRIVSATNQSLQDQVERDIFRGDLFYRLNSITVRIPPLRDRGVDILLLSQHFMAQYVCEFARPLRGLSSDAFTALGDHAWPGNVRELANRIRRAVLMTEQQIVSAADLELAPSTEDTAAYSLRAARSRAERDVVHRALVRSGGVMATAARLLGISRPTLYALVESHCATADYGLATQAKPRNIEDAVPATTAVQHIGRGK